MEEISSLPDMRLIDVLGFIRYLKMERQNAPSDIQAWFEHALRIIHDEQKKSGSDHKDVEAQIRAYENP